MAGDSVIELATAALLMRVGVALYSAGMSRSKNMVSASMRAIADFAIAGTCFWAVGAAVQFGVSWFLGGEFVHPLSQLHEESEILKALCGVLMASGFAVAAIGERSTGAFAAVISAFLGAILLPITGMLADVTGWLSAHHFSDFAGASYLFLATGICAVIAARIVGPRLGKYTSDDSIDAMPAHNFAIASAGILLIAAAWIPFLCSTALDAKSVHVALCVLLAGNGGVLAGLFFGRVREGKSNVRLTLSALLAALIAIAAGADSISAGGALLTGVVAGLLAPAAVLALDCRYHIDDVAGASAAAIVGGAWGTLATGIFSPAASFSQRLSHIFSQLEGIVAISVVSIMASIIVLRAATKFVVVRAGEAEELDGLDIAEHG